MITEITGAMLFPFNAIGDMKLIPDMYLCLVKKTEQTQWCILEYTIIGAFMVEEEDIEILGFFRLQQSNEAVSELRVYPKTEGGGE